MAISVDDEVAAVDARTGEDLFRISMGRLLIRSMHAFADYSKILIFHEIGVALISDIGETLWSFSRDVVANSSIADGVIALAFMDEPPTRLSIESGQELQE